MSTISGTVTLNDGTTTSGVIVTIVDTEADTIMATTTTASDGTWSYTTGTNTTVHVFFEYEDTSTGTYYTGDSRPYVNTTG